MLEVDNLEKRSAHEWAASLETHLSGKKTFFDVDCLPRFPSPP